MSKICDVLKVTEMKWGRCVWKDSVCVREMLSHCKTEKEVGDRAASWTEITHSFWTCSKKRKIKKENVLLSIWLEVGARHLEMTLSSPRHNFCPCCQVQHRSMLYVSKNLLHIKPAVSDYMTTMTKPIAFVPVSEWNVWPCIKATREERARLYHSFHFHQLWSCTIW